MSDAAPWLLLAGLVLVLLGWYLLFSARRLDRLHRRVEGAAAALDNQLLRRATAATDLAISGVLDPASSMLLTSAAAQALEAGEERAAQIALDPWSGSRLADHDHEREVAESDLSRALRATLDALPADDPAVTGHQLDALAAVGHRVRLARRFHNDAVSHACAVRSKRVVRWARLAGSAPPPLTLEMDDEPALVLGTTAGLYPEDAGASARPGEPPVPDQLE